MPAKEGEKERIVSVIYKTIFDAIICEKCPHLNEFKYSPRMK